MQRDLCDCNMVQGCAFDTYYLYFYVAMYRILSNASAQTHFILKYLTSIWYKGHTLFSLTWTLAPKAQLSTANHLNCEANYLVNWYTPPFPPWPPDSFPQFRQLPVLARLRNYPDIEHWVHVDIFERETKRVRGLDEHIKGHERHSACTFSATRLWSPTQVSKVVVV